MAAAAVAHLSRLPVALVAQAVAVMVVAAAPEQPEPMEQAAAEAGPALMALLRDRLAARA